MASTTARCRNNNVRDATTITSSAKSKSCLLEEHLTVVLDIFPEHVLSFLCIEDTLHLMATSRTMYIAANSPIVWRNLVHTTFRVPAKQLNDLLKKERALYMLHHDRLAEEEQRRCADMQARSGPAGDGRSSSTVMAPRAISRNSRPSSTIVTTVFDRKTPVTQHPSTFNQQQQAQQRCSSVVCCDSYPQTPVLSSYSAPASAAKQYPATTTTAPPPRVVCFDDDESKDEANTNRSSTATPLDLGTSLVVNETSEMAAEFLANADSNDKNVRQPSHFSSMVHPRVLDARAIGGEESVGDCHTGTGDAEGNPLREDDDGDAAAHNSNSCSTCNSVEVSPTRLRESARCPTAVEDEEEGHPSEDTSSTSPPSTPVSSSASNADAVVTNEHFWMRDADNNDNAFVESADVRLRRAAQESTPVTLPTETPPQQSTEYQLCGATAHCTLTASKLMYPWRNLFKTLYTHRVTNWLQHLRPRRSLAIVAATDCNYVDAISELDAIIDWQVQGGLQGGCVQALCRTLSEDLQLRGHLRKSLGSLEAALGDFALAAFVHPENEEAEAHAIDIITTTGATPPASFAAAPSQAHSNDFELPTFAVSSAPPSPATPTSHFGRRPRAEAILSPAFDFAAQCDECLRTGSVFDRASFLFEVMYWRGPTFSCLMHQYLLGDAIKLFPIHTVCRARKLSEHVHQRLLCEAWLNYDRGDHDAAKSCAELSVALLPTTCQQESTTIAFKEALLSRKAHRDALNSNFNTNDGPDAAASSSPYPELTNILREHDVAIPQVKTSTSSPSSDGSGRTDDDVDLLDDDTTFHILPRPLPSFSFLSSPSAQAPQSVGGMMLPPPCAAATNEKSLTDLDQREEKQLLHPDAGFAFFTLGYVTRRDPDVSLKAYAKHLLTEPHLGRRAIACNNVGNILLLRGDTDEALRWLQEAIFCNPSFYMGYKNLARTLGKLGNRQAAFAVLTLAIANCSKSTSGSNGNITADAFAERSKYAHLVHGDLSAATRLNPRLSHAYRLRAALLMDRQMHREALEELDKVISISLEPQDLSLRALFRHDLGLHAEAVVDMSLSLTLSPDCKDFQIWLSTCKRKHRDHLTPSPEKQQHHSSRSGDGGNNGQTRNGESGMTPVQPSNTPLMMSATPSTSALNDGSSSLYVNPPPATPLALSLRAQLASVSLNGKTCEDRAALAFREFLRSGSTFAPMLSAVSCAIPADISSGSTTRNEHGSSSPSTFGHQHAPTAFSSSSSAAGAASTPPLQTTSSSSSSLQPPASSGTLHTDRTYSTTERDDIQRDEEEDGSGHGMKQRGGRRDDIDDAADVASSSVLKNNKIFNFWDPTCTQSPLHYTAEKQWTECLPVVAVADSKASPSPPAARALPPPPKTVAEVRSSRPKK